MRVALAALAVVAAPFLCVGCVAYTYRLALELGTPEPGLVTFTALVLSFVFGGGYVFSRLANT